MAAEAPGSWEHSRIMANLAEAAAAAIGADTLLTRVGVIDHGRPVSYDEMSERAHINYAGGTDEARRLRDLLRAAMEHEGFAVYEPEWWHYDYKDWASYPILNIRFSEIGKRRR